MHHEKEQVLIEGGIGAHWGLGNGYKGLLFFLI
jgi:hypothetical protein